MEDLRPILDVEPSKNGVEPIPLEIKVLASLRHMGRGECWDTIVELCNDKTCITTLSNFFRRFIKAMREVYEETMIHPPRTSTELESVLTRSEKRGIPGCVGFLDGVHVQWDKCPSQWKHISIGKCDYPTIGWQCACNHNRRFISVQKANLGSINDQNAIKMDRFVSELRTNPLYRDWNYTIYDATGGSHEESGLWLSVDGGYIRIPECLVGEPLMFHAWMSKWTTFMESERKHIECAFGILKSRFRILKLPIRMHKFEEIDDMFHTCCILHNMCLDYDGLDEGWDLGTCSSTGFEPGPDGYFSDDDNHRFYYSRGMFYDIFPDIDYSEVGITSVSSLTLGGKRDTQNFVTKRNKMAKHWYYMYRQGLIDFDFKF